MDWFSGEISNAIQSAKSKRSLIIVYISGDDNKSSECDALWEDQDVAEVCRNNESVALKLSANSDSCKQFSAIYPVVVIPCTFLIGDNGIPLDVLACEMSKETLVAKISAAFEKHKSSQALSPEPDASAPGAGEDVPLEGGAEAVGAAMGVTPPHDKKESELSKDEKVQRAKELIVERQAKKLTEEKEKEKQREIERIELGQSAAKLSQRKQELEVKDMKKQWQKDKEADRLARDRVREQIARDRAEKSEAYQKVKDAKDKEQRDRENAKRTRLDEEERVVKERDQQRRNEVARIQFRIPDGSSVTHDFVSTNTLQVVEDFITQHVRSQPGSLTLSTLYPRRVFTPEDMDQTVLELGLTPSAVIMVTFNTHTHANSAFNPLYQLFSFVVAPFSLVWNFVYGFLFGFALPASSSPAATGVQGADNSGLQESTVVRDSSQRPNRAHKRRAPDVSRTDGNIHRFARQTGNDDDDENATWNGNSTQQM